MAIKAPRRDRVNRAAVIIELLKDDGTVSRVLYEFEPSEPIRINHDMSKGTDLIAAERERQVTEEGYTPEHDIGHAHELAAAAAVYADAATVKIREGESVALPNQWARGRGWPWAMRYWKPTGDPVRDLVKAGALIAAAIDSLTEGTKTND